MLLNARDISCSFCSHSSITSSHSRPSPYQSYDSSSHFVHAESIHHCSSHQFGKSLSTWSLHGPCVLQYNRIQYSITERLSPNTPLTPSINHCINESKKELGFGCKHVEMAPGGQLLKQYLGLLNNAISNNDGHHVCSLLPIEPPFSQDYLDLLNDVFGAYPDAGQQKDIIRSGVKAVAKDDKDSWAAFPEFLQTYFQFIRSVDPADLLTTYERLSNLINKAHGALKNDPFGILILPTTIEYAKVLARLAIGLDKQPHLIAHLQVADDDQSSSLPELAAMNLRPIIGTCARDTRPNGKGSAVYKLANLCMKILFQCDKPEGVPNFYNAVVMHNRPLNNYPRSERVTYLYYLGRYFCVSAQFYFALITLEAAYAECHRLCVKQRRLILVYLIASSIILGRFPSPQLYARPEAHRFEERFRPITDAIKRGDLASFFHHTSLEGPNANWFLYFGILYQLRNRCEPLVWRSLARRTFSSSSTLPSATEQPSDKTSEGRQKAATLDLITLLSVSHSILSSSPVFNIQASIDADFSGLSQIMPDEQPFSTTTLPTIDDIECSIASLCVLGLMNGFVSQKLRKFAIKGAKGRRAVDAGWPVVFPTLMARVQGGGGGSHGPDVPGWKKVEGQGGGMVISMAGAAAAGS